MIKVSYVNNAHYKIATCILKRKEYMYYFYKKNFTEHVKKTPEKLEIAHETS